MKSFQALIDEKLMEDQKKYDERERSGKITPSTLGRCYRFQWWKIKGEKPSDPLDPLTLRVFKCGKLFHDFMQGLLADIDHEVKIETSDILGFADTVNRDTVYDLKSVNPRQFNLMKDKGFDPNDRLTYCLQIMTYAMLLQKTYGVLVFISKDTLEVIEERLHIDDWRDKVSAELEAVRTALAGPLPEPIPRAYGGRECSYCNYKTLCGRPLAGKKKEKIDYTVNEVKNERN